MAFGLLSTPGLSEARRYTICTFMSSVAGNVCPATLAAVHTLQCPAVLAWAARGPLGQEPGLYSPARLAQAHLPADVRTVRLDADHYGTLLDPGSLDALADALHALVAGPRSGRGIHIPIR